MIHLYQEWDTQFLSQVGYIQIKEKVSSGQFYNNSCF